MQCIQDDSGLRSVTCAGIIICNIERSSTRSHTIADRSKTLDLYAGAAWLSIRLDAIGLTVLTAAALLAVSSDIDPALAGLSLTYALDLTKFLKFGTRMASKLETDFNSVERLAEYLDVRSDMRE